MEVSEGQPYLERDAEGNLTGAHPNCSTNSVNTALKPSKSGVRTASISVIIEFASKWRESPLRL